MAELRSGQVVVDAAVEMPTVARVGQVVVDAAIIMPTGMRVGQVVVDVMQKSGGAIEFEDTVTCRGTRPDGKELVLVYTYRYSVSSAGTGFARVGQVVVDVMYLPEAP